MSWYWRQMEDTAAKAAMWGGPPEHMSAGIVSWGLQMHTFLVEPAESAHNLQHSTAGAAEIRDRKFVKTIWICMAILVRILEKDWLRNMALLVRNLHLIGFQSVITY